MTRFARRKGQGCRFVGPSVHCVTWALVSWGIFGCGTSSMVENEGPGEDPPECSSVARSAESARLFLTFEEKDEDAFVDVSPDGRRGITAGTVARVEGRCGWGASFDGSESWIEVPDDPVLDGSAGFTQEMWMRLDAWAEVSKPVQKQNPETFIEFAYGILVANDGGFVTLDLPGCRVVGTEGMIGLGRWIHIAAVWDPSDESGRLYVDGRLDSSNITPCEGPYAGAGWPLVIGGVRNCYDVWFPFPGAVDNVAFFDHPRTAEQVCADSLGTWDGSTCARPAGEGAP